jgi:prophage regulatory protein
MSVVFLRLKSVMAATGLSRSALYAAIAAGTFPKQVKIGAQSSAWPASEVDAWQAARVAERDRQTERR